MRDDGESCRGQGGVERHPGGSGIARSVRESASISPIVASVTSVGGKPRCLNTGEARVQGGYQPAHLPEITIVYERRGGGAMPFGQGRGHRLQS